MLVSYLGYSLTLKLEAICPSETPIDSQRTTWCYVTDNRTLREVSGLLNTLKPEIHLTNIYQNSFRTSQETHYVTIAKANRFTPSKIITNKPVCDNIDSV
jgi:hypothetical protein